MRKTVFNLLIAIENIVALSAHYMEKKICLFSLEQQIKIEAPNEPTVYDKVNSFL